MKSIRRNRRMDKNMPTGREQDMRRVMVTKRTREPGE